METKIVTIDGRQYLAIPLPAKVVLPDTDAKKVEDTEEDLTIGIKIGEHDITLSRKKVIDILEENREKLKDYKTAYLEWGNEKFAIKSIFELVTKIPKVEYNTVLAESYLNRLGFVTKRLR